LPWLRLGSPSLVSISSVTWATEGLVTSDLHEVKALLEAIENAMG
jgi:hypothetical protein